MSTLSVITLTCNRLGKLQRLVERLLPQLEAGDELLLVDTGSTDGTREHFTAPETPEAIRLAVFEGEGSWAEMRNFGVSRARGSMAAFLDDDCLPTEDWVARGKAALAEADAVGGIARPLGIRRFPAWWHPDMGWMVGLSVPGHAGPDAGRVHYPYTANLWVRTSVCRERPFQEIGGELGGQEGARYLAGREDAQWWRALRTTGYRTRFDPGLAVVHGIDPLRLDLDYLRQRAGQDGRAWAVREGTREDFAPLAYQWWLNLSLALGAIGRDHDEWGPHWHYHQLTRRRHGEALDELARRFYPDRPLLRALRPWQLMAAARLAWNSTKAAARRTLQPLLATRPEHPTARRVERLAVIAFGFLGDLVILQSALRGLMRSHPAVELYVIAPPVAAVALRGLPRLNLTLTPALRPGSSAARDWLAHWLERLDPDAIVAPYLHEPWGGTLTGLRRPPRPVIGFDHDQGLRRQWQLERLTVRVCKDLTRHEGLNLCALLAAAGLPCAPEPATLAPLPKALVRLSEQPWLAAQGGTAPVMFNPCAGKPNKEWTNEGWTLLARRILQENDWPIIINAARPLPQLESALGDGSGRIHWLRAVHLDDLLAWLSVCRALVTVDAGPQHLAHGLGIPSVTLYGPMDERRWHDLWGRPLHRTLRGCAYDLTPEEKRGLPQNHEVARIDPDTIFATLLELNSMKVKPC